MSLNIDKKISVKKEELINTIKNVLVNPKADYNDYNEFVEFIMPKIKDNQTITLEYNISVSDKEEGSVVTVSFKVTFDTAEKIEQSDLPSGVTISVNGKKVTFRILKEVTMKEVAIEKSVEINLNREKSNKINDKILSLFSKSEILLSSIIKSNDELDLLRNDEHLFTLNSRLLTSVNNATKLLNELNVDEVDIEKLSILVDSIEEQLLSSEEEVANWNDLYKIFLLSVNDKKQDAKEEKETKNKEFKFDKSKFFKEAKKPLLYTTIGAGIAIGVGTLYNVFKK